jgi:signal transduction histidine kinase
MLGPLMGRDNVHVSLQLPDETWLNFVAPFEAAPPFWSLRFALSVSLMALAVAAFSIWVARRLTAPLRGFAHAAERLGVDVHAPPLPEQGTREVRQATRAFNQMQKRIRRFIDNRTQMFAAISHDLRTPITRLRLRAEFVEDPAQQAKMLADLDEMEAMISSTLSFARDEAGDEPRETVDLVALVARVCDDLADAGLAATFSGEGREPYSCRPIALRRAFSNLIENGANYGERARVSLSAQEGRVLVQIDDDGPGIPEDQMENLFKPFFRLEGSRSRETGGTGLGLTVARTVIRAHGGEITIHNRPEGGLRVEVVLPR